MIDVLGIATLAAVLLLGAILTLYNSRQAAALREMEQVLSDWYLMQVAERRERKRQTIRIENPLAWLSEQAGVQVMSLERRLDNPA